MWEVCVKQKVAEVLDASSKMNYLKEKRVRIEGEGLFVKREEVFQGENNQGENNQNFLVEKEGNIQLSHG